jgi:hypothetical protein
MTSIRIPYHDADPGTEAHRAFEAAIDAGVFSLSPTARNYAGEWFFTGSDADPKRGRPARNFLFEDEDETGSLAVPIPTEQEPDAGDDREAPPSFITGGHIRALQVVQTDPNTTLSSVRIDGEPGVAVVAVREVMGSLQIMPLFIAITDSMDIEYLEFDYRKKARKGSGETRRAKRPFDAVEEVTRPVPKVA